MVHYNYYGNLCYCGSESPLDNITITRPNHQQYSNVITLSKGVLANTVKYTDNLHAVKSVFIICILLALPHKIRDWCIFVLIGYAL